MQNQSEAGDKSTKTETARRAAAAKEKTKCPPSPRPSRLRPAARRPLAAERKCRQPEPARGAFNYCLALMMVEAGKAKLIETRPGEAGTICVFESSAGDVFSLARPAMSAEREAEGV